MDAIDKPRPNVPIPTATSEPAPSQITARLTNEPSMSVNSTFGRRKRAAIGMPISRPR